MSTTAAPSRLPGAALLLGGVLTGCALIAGDLIGEQRIDTVRVAVSVVEVVGGLLVLLGMPVLLRGTAGPGRPFLVAGYVLVFTVVALVQVFLSLTFALVVPWVAGHGVDVSQPPPALGAVLFVSQPLAVLGIALLAAGMLRSTVHPRWNGWALVGSAVLSAAALAGLPDVADLVATVVLFAVFAVSGARELGAVGNDEPDRELRPA
jgi:hypothetical protein